MMENGEKYCGVVENNVVLTADPTAAAINSLADTIGDWADRKKFREDWENADWLCELAGYIDLTRQPQDDWSEARLTEAADRLREIANNHRRLANVCKLMLMVSELTEALEGMRDGGNYGEEIADLIIRALENSHKNNVPIGDEVIKKVAKNETRPIKHGRQF